MIDPNEPPIKIVVVGDGAIGKTCLCVAYTDDKFDMSYEPTVFQNYTGIATYGGKTYTIGIYDTAGQESYDQFRPLSYPQTDVFLLCYSIVGRTSFENVELKWVTELKTHCPSGSIILVGTKKDLLLQENVVRRLKAEGMPHVTTEEGKAMAEKIGAVGFVETSSLTREGIQEAFRLAVKHCAESRAAAAKPAASVTTNNTPTSNRSNHAGNDQHKCCCELF